MKVKHENMKLYFKKISPIFTSLLKDKYSL